VHQQASGSDLDDEDEEESLQSDVDGQDNEDEEEGNDEVEPDVNAEMARLQEAQAKSLACLKQQHAGEIRKSEIAQAKVLATCAQVAKRVKAQPRGEWRRRVQFFRSRCGPNGVPTGKSKACQHKYGRRITLIHVIYIECTSDVYFTLFHIFLYEFAGSDTCYPF